jgi:phosphomannomutase
MSPSQKLALLASTAGDDVRGIASEDAPNPFTPASAYWIGAAFRAWLGTSEMIAVGRDPRPSSVDISVAFCRGAEAQDAGPATTPAMLEALLAPATPYAGAVMVTASHLPSEWNGLKFFARSLGRGLNKREVKEVMALAAEMAAGGRASMEAMPATAHGFMAPYVDKLKAAVREADGSGVERPLEGMTVTAAHATAMHACAHA